MIKTVIFDMGNVLVNFDHAKAAAQIAVLCGTTPQDIWQHLFASGLELQFEAGLVSTQELHRMLEQRYGKTLALDQLIDAVCNIFSPKLEMLPILKSLKAQGLHIQVLSNTNVLHWQYCRSHFEFANYFDAHTLSFEVKALKPEAPIYLDAIKKSGVAANECFYTDDIAAYADAATKLGMHGFQFINAAKVKNDLASVGIQV